MVDKKWTFGTHRSSLNHQTCFGSLATTPEMKLNGLRNRYKKKLCTWDGLKNLQDILPLHKERDWCFLCDFFEFQHALLRKRKLKKHEKREHWLDYADDKYDKTLINDTKAILHVLFLFLPLPIFWALFEQQVSMLIYAEFW